MLVDDATRYRALWNGTLRGVLQWAQLDALWACVRGQPAGWYVLQAGEAVPTAPSPSDAVVRFVDELDALLREEHRHDYCGIVYADDREAPTLIKVFDPAHLGSACGASGTPAPPRWVLSRLPPLPIDDAAPAPAVRRRWWQRWSAT